MNKYKTLTRVTAADLKRKTKATEIKQDKSAAVKETSHKFLKAASTFQLLMPQFTGPEIGANNGARKVLLAGMQYLPMNSSVS